jgi:PAS domain S-box-containing protein
MNGDRGEGRWAATGRVAADSASLESVRPVLDALSAQVALLSTEGVVLLANRAALESSRLDQASVLGLPLWDTPWFRDDPDARQDVRAAVERAANGQTSRYDESIQAGGGRITVDMEIRPAVPTPGAAPSHLVWSAVDCTDLRSSQDVQDRMAAIVEHSPDFVATMTADGRLLSLNRAGRRMVGLSPAEEIVGRTLGEFHPHWARTLVDEVARPWAREKGSWVGRSALVSPAGEEIPISQVIVAHYDTAGAVRYFSTVARDATEERQAENRLETEVAIGEILEESESFRGAMGEILRAFTLFLKADLAELWLPEGERLSRAMFEVGAHGASAWEPVADGTDRGSLPLHELVHEGRSPILACAGLVLGAKEGEVQLPSFASSGLGFAIDSPQGFIGAVTVYWRGAVEDLGLRTSAGRIAREIAALFRREQAEASLRHAQALAEAASQAKSDFVANMSHEIRSPMTAILGYIELLNRSLSDPDDLQMLDTIRRNGEHLLEIVSDILDLSKIEAGRMEPEPRHMSPGKTVQEVLGLMSVRAAERGLPLTISFDTALPSAIVSDPVAIRQILLNLVSNAIKFTSEGSVQLRLAMRGESIEFRVDDTGIGIPEGVVERLFEPFAQLDTSSARAYGGTGLGLAISSRLAKALHGTLTVESTLGRGSSFTLTVPIGTDEYALVQPADLDRELKRHDMPEPVRAPRQLRGRVLAVDDRLDMRILFRHLFEEAGAQVEVASDGESALRAVEASIASGNEFDAIVMDVQMPRMDGLTATRELRRRGYRAPIIALTAGAQPVDRERALQAGCDEFVAKPISGPALKDVVWRYLGGRPPEAKKRRDSEFSGCAVLLVEDDQSVAAVMEALFEGWGCSVRVARNAEEALERARAGTVDVVFSDLNLPKVSGSQLLPLLKELHTCASAVCVSLSGHGGREGQLLSSRAGFDRHLVKPARLDDLRDVLRTATRRDRSPTPSARSAPA